MKRFFLGKLYMVGVLMFSVLVLTACGRGQTVSSVPEEPFDTTKAPGTLSTAAPTETPVSIQTVAPTETPVPTPTTAPTETLSPTPMPTMSPTPTHTPTEAPTPTPILRSAIICTSPSERKIPVYNVETDEPQVALTFDIAWGNEDVYRILDILDSENVKATFFFVGEWVTKYPEEVKAIYERGHEIANHGESHKDMATLSEEECIAEIQLVHDRVKELLGIDMTLFRVPSGSYNNLCVETANSMGYHVIQWNVDSHDWMDKGVEDIIDRVANNSKLGNGAIILMHTGTLYTEAALKEAIVRVKEQGYEFVTVSELIYDVPVYRVNALGKQLKPME